MAKLNKDRIQRAAEKYIRSGNNKKAVDEYEKWISVNPKDWNMVRLAADLYARMGQKEEAIKKYTHIAEYYRNDGFNVRAIATYKMILRLDTHNERAMANLADLQVAQGLLMEAKSQYQTLVELYNKSGQKKRAKEVFKKLADIDPSDLKVRYKYAEYLDRQGQAEEAISEYVGIADEFINNGLVPEAMQIMEKGLRIDSYNRSLRCKLAQASVLQGDYARAIQLLSEIRGKFPEDLELLTRLGEAYMGAGNLDEAEATFGRLAELDADNPDHTSRRAELAIGQADFDGALQLMTPLVDKFVGASDGDKASVLLQKVLNKDPHHVKTLVKLAEIHTVLKNEQARLSAYDKLCEAYNQHGNYEKAVHVAEQLIDLEPENSQHKDRLRFLKSRLGEDSIPDEEPLARPRASSVDIDLPGLESMDVAEGLQEEISGTEFSELAGSAEPVDLDTESIHTLSAEDEENIKEKLTEAEVFVRYGLVDKAVDQLKDVLQSFRFRVDAREKLIEIYKEQGMNREASEQMVDLARVHQRLGEPEVADQLLQDARALDSDVEFPAQPAVAADEEIELTLTPEEDLSGAGLETDFVAEPADDVFQEEVPISLDSASFAAIGSESSDGVDALAEVEDAGLNLETHDEFQIDVDLDSGVDVHPGKSAGIMQEEELKLEEEIPGIYVEDESPDEADVPTGKHVAIEEESPDEADVPTEQHLAIEDELPVEDDVSLADEILVEEPMLISEDVPAEESVSVEEEKPAIIEELDPREMAVEEDFALDDDPVEALQELSLPVSDGDEEAIELEIPTTEPTPMDEIPIMDTGEDLGVVAENQGEEIAVEFSDVISESSSPEIEIPEMPAAEQSAPELEIPEMLAADQSSPELEIPEMLAADQSSPELEIPEVLSPEPSSPELEIQEMFSTEQSSPELEIPATLSAEQSSPELEIPEMPSAEPSVPELEIPEMPSLEQSSPELEISEILSPEPAPPPANEATVSAELQEVDEYIALGLYEDARDSLRELLKVYPDDPNIIERIEELGFSSAQIKKEAEGVGIAEESSESPSMLEIEDASIDSRTSDGKDVFPLQEEQPVSIEDLSGSELETEPLESVLTSTTKAAPEPFVDLASALSQEMLGTQSAVSEEEAREEPAGAISDPGLDEIFREFKKGVEKQLGTEDYDTRYNLGIAYKEMGLLDEAIAEFQLAAKDTARLLECCSMLGLCFMEKGMPEIAIKWFEKGLSASGRNEEEYHGLRYDLAQAHEASGSPETALELYMDIYRVNARFRDVKERVRDLQAASN